jgi:hypothetical protein
MFDHIVGHFRHRFVLQNTGEFFSPDFHSGRPEAYLFLAILLATIAALAWSSRRPTLQEGACFLSLSFFALYSVRNIPLFAITVTPILAAQLEALPALEGRWAALADRVGRWFAARDRAIASADAQTRAPLWSAVGVLALVFVAGVQWRTGQLPLGITFDPTRLPVAAADYLAANPPAGNGFANQQWGGYLLHRLWPQHRVFIDGQTDFYGDELSREYLGVITLSEGWRETLEKHQVRWVVSYTGSGLVEQLERGGGWTRVHRDQLATVLVRQGLAGP